MSQNDRYDNTVKQTHRSTVSIHIPTHSMLYTQVAYYARQFERDVARVLDRFRQATAAGLPIYEARRVGSVCVLSNG